MVYDTDLQHLLLLSDSTTRRHTGAKFGDVSEGFARIESRYPLNT